MNEILTVVPGHNLNQHLMGRPVTLRWVRTVMRDHPEWDWRVIGGPFINAEHCVRYDATLRVVNPLNPKATVCYVNYQRSDDRYQAVVFTNLTK